MEALVSAVELGQRIKQRRKQKGYSQEQLATFLNISRSAVVQLENGKRSLSALELVTLGNVLSFSLDAFLATDYEPLHIETPIDPQQAEDAIRVSVPDFAASRFKNILLYVLERCGGKANVGETVLNKLLYFADFNHYELYETHLSGARYKKLPFGPVPQNIDGILAQMTENGQLQRLNTNYHGYPQTRYLALEKPDLTQMTGAQKEVLDQVIDHYSDWSATAISDYSHKDLPWKATKEGDFIDYELAFYREAPFSVRMYDDETNPAT